MSSGPGRDVRSRVFLNSRERCALAVTLVALLILGTSCPGPKKTDANEKIGPFSAAPLSAKPLRVWKGRVRVYSRPDRKSRLLYTLRMDEQVIQTDNHPVLEGSGDHWIEIRTGDGRKGWTIEYNLGRNIPPCETIQDFPRLKKNTCAGPYCALAGSCAEGAYFFSDGRYLERFGCHDQPAHGRWTVIGSRIQAVAYVKMNIDASCEPGPTDACAINCKTGAAEDGACETRCRKKCRADWKKKYGRRIVKRRYEYRFRRDGNGAIYSLSLMKRARQPSGIGATDINAQGQPRETEHGCLRRFSKYK